MKMKDCTTCLGQVKEDDEWGGRNKLEIDGQLKHEEIVRERKPFEPL